MWLELPPFWIVVLNALGIPAIHLGISWAFTKLPRASFDPSSWLFRERSWERGGRIYQDRFRIRRWKGYLPDAAPWFDGFAKGQLTDKGADHLRVFLAETCRGDAAHHAQILCLLVTLLWNPWPVSASVMIVYAFASNLPCIFLQRYTRARLQRTLATRGPRRKGSGA